MTEPTSAYDADFRHFSAADRGTILDALKRFVADASESQHRAWRDAIPQLQNEVREVVFAYGDAGRYHAVLEYRLPMEFRRIDAVFLLHGMVVVLELKGKWTPSEADIDQAHAYARDLRCYHAECEDRPVEVVLVPTLARDVLEVRRGVHVCAPALLDGVLARFDRETRDAPLVSLERFLDPDAYRPLPSLVRAARELFEHGTLTRIRRASAATDPAIALLSSLAREAAATRRRKLVLLSGVPGAGKTLVGLRLVHAHFIDDLAVDRGNGKPTSPAVFLSGNGPLVEVLQYELRDAGGGGRTFVRGVKQYVQRYASDARRRPPEHVLVYDEAQRAYDAEMVAEKHGHDPSSAKSEPQWFVEFAERIPEWCVILALIGSGQEIHKGEEAGVGQWADALRGSARSGDWDVHGPVGLSDAFAGRAYSCHVELSLDVSLRSHLSLELHRFVAGLVASPATPAPELRLLSQRLTNDGHDLRLCRDLEIGKTYLRERYADVPAARFGIVASSRDRDLERLGIPNDFQSTKRIRHGPWYGDPEDIPGSQSCRLLRDCVTEFGAQGLELDATLVAWGTDFRFADGRWDVSRMRRYARGGAPVRDAAQLRANAYRVLLTRARDASVIFVPPLPELDETWAFLRAAGFRPLEA
jgi:hypothetical protein